jgi:hypothetical protein
MGRFDALTELEEKPTQEPSPVEKEEKVRKTANPQTALHKSPQNRLPSSPQADKTASGFTDKTASGQNRKTAKEKPDRYTTRLRADMVKRIKVFAAERDMDDYEVVEQALTEYFERNK